MTPNDIDVLIHCHTSGTVHPRYHAPAVHGSIASFVEDGILVHYEGNQYRTTGKGQALMAMLCSTPYPVEAWVDANGKVIEL